MMSQKHDIIFFGSGLVGLRVAIVSKVVNRYCERPLLRRDNDEDSKYQVTTQ